MRVSSLGSDAEPVEAVRVPADRAGVSSTRLHDDGRGISSCVAGSARSQPSTVSAVVHSASVARPPTRRSSTAGNTRPMSSARASNWPHHSCGARWGALD